MNIGIIGLGLMGGSIYKGLKDAIPLGENWAERLLEIDVLILAVPISAILEIGEKIASMDIQKPLLVLDIGSVKGIIAKQFERWTKGRLEFIASHPMTGKEQSGFEHSDPALFQDAPWILTPHSKNQEASLQKIERLIEQLGSRPIRMDAEIHDRKAALISHMPYILSKALWDFVISTDKESLAIAGPGFRSMVRLAQDNKAMRQEIEQWNQHNIADSLEVLLKNLGYQKSGGFDENDRLSRS